MKRSRSRWRAAWGITVAVVLASTAVATMPGRAEGVAQAAEGARAQAMARADAPLRAAALQAKQTGRAVTVAAMTTATSTTTAKPDGSFSMTSSALPVRVRRHGVWVPVNATLHRAANGWYEPVATMSDLTLSAGGGGPLAVLTSSSGASLSFTFPFRLPAPVIKGATATYRGVRPGIDLVVTTNTLGSFSDVLVIHDRAAADALRVVRIVMKETGVNLRVDAAGNLIATGARGRLEFTGPAPTMWDSTSSGPDLHRHAAPLRMRLVGGALILTPDAALVSSASTRFPLFIDPTVTPVTSSVEGDQEVQEGCPNINNWNQLSSLGTGYQNAPGTACQGLYRAYYQINTTNLNSSMRDVTATLYTVEDYGSDNDCSHAWPVTLEWTAGISPSTSWSQQPSVEANLGTAWPLSAWCGNQDVNFDVSSVMGQTAANNWGTWTFGLIGDEELRPQTYCAPASEYNCGYMRFASNPIVVTNFDLYPPVPNGSTVSPSPHDPGGSVDQGCNASGTYGWLGRSDLGAGNGSSVALNTTVNSGIVGENVRAQFTVSDQTLGGSVVAAPDSQYVVSGTAVSVPVGIALQDGHQYGYSATAYDGQLQSGSSPTCYFNVDLTPPQAPTVASSSFPPSGSTPGTSLYVGETGTFSFASSDPAPTGCTTTCQASGVAGFEYSFNSPIPTTGAQTATPGTSVSFTPTVWGTNTLYVAAVDNAGNVSQETLYDFYVPWIPGAKVTAGDINGDGIPDLLTTDSAGNLLLYSGGTDPSVQLVGAGTPATSPDGTGWSTFEVTHRGSMSQGTVDDLFAHKGTELWLYRNDGGTAPQFADTANIDLLQKPACTYNATYCAGYDAADWGAVSQILAPGDVYKGSTGDLGYPSLLTVEDGQLWAYQGIPGDHLSDPVRLSPSGWDSMTLIAPGNVGGVLTLWAVDMTTGDLYSYPLKLSSVTGLPASLGPATGTGSKGTLVTNVQFAHGQYPMLASSGALTKGAYPGLYAADNSGQLWYYPGEPVTGGASPLTGARQLVGVPGTGWP